MQFDSIVGSSFLKQIPLKFPLVKKKPEIFLDIFIPDLIILVEQVMVVFAVYIMSEGWGDKHHFLHLVVALEMSNSTLFP